MKYHEGSLYSGSNTTNSDILFDVINPCLLASVKVYTDLPGNRLIELRKANGDVLQSAMINIPVDSTRITLNFNLTPGSYQLGTNSNQNQILWGHDSPYLQRSSEGVNYPYVIEDLVSLNGSDQGQDVYYYFYDWEVQKLPTICVSDRTPVTVFTNAFTGISAAAGGENINVYPNPTQGNITITSAAQISGNVTIYFTDLTGRVILSYLENGWKTGDKIQLDLSSYPKGIYFLNIKTGKGMVQNMVLLQ
jgi:hypothetical protein